MVIVGGDEGGVEIGPRIVVADVALPDHQPAVAERRDRRPARKILTEYHGLGIEERPVRTAHAHRERMHEMGAGGLIGADHQEHVAQRRRVRAVARHDQERFGLDRGAVREQAPGEDAACVAVRPGHQEQRAVPGHRRIGRSGPRITTIELNRAAKRGAACIQRLDKDGPLRG
jgi:hypothetical protein